MGDVKTIQIPISYLKSNPFSLRNNENRESLENLSRSIKAYGMLQPISVKKTGLRQYEIIAGERRVKAAQMAGFKKVPAVVVSTEEEKEAAVISLVENMQREGLSFIEEAKAYHYLIVKNNFTQEELASKIGKSQSAIANKLRLLKLSSLVKKILVENNLTERHARALLKLGNEKLRLRVLKKICERNLSVKKTEELVEKVLARISAGGTVSNAQTKMTKAIKDIRIFINTIRQAVDMMKREGIDAKAAKVDRGEYVEFIVRIPKNIGR